MPVYLQTGLAWVIDFICGGGQGEQALVRAGRDHRVVALADRLVEGADKGGEQGLAGPAGTKRTRRRL